MRKKWTKLNYAVHPGEILKEYLDDSGMTQIELAKKIGINKIIINEIINGKRPITMKTAIKLEKAFSFNAQFWRNLQMIYDETVERLKIKHAEQTSYTQTIVSEINPTENIVEHINSTTNIYATLAIAAA